MYTEKVMEHFSSPKNVGVLDDYNGYAKVGNESCGDVMEIYLKVEDNKIKDVSFRTFGCAAAIATSSVATEMIKGKTVDEALELTNKTVTDELGGLPPVKRHCSVLAEEGIQGALKNYKSNNI